MKINGIKKITGKIKKEFVSLFVAVIIFSSVFYSIFFQSNLSEEEIIKYSESLEGNYSEYSNKINSTSVNIKDLVNSEQVKKMEYYGKLLIKEGEYNRGREDPFVKEDDF